MRNKYELAGVTYTVEEVEFVEIGNDTDIMSGHDFKNCEIQILKNMSLDNKKQSLAKELTHAIFYEAGYKEQDENMIDRISLVLYEFLDDLEDKSWLKV